MIQWPNIGLYGEFAPCEQGVLQAINENFKILDTLVQMRVLDFVTELPNDPNPGDRYILEDSDYFYSGSGSVIAVWNDEQSEWEYITPQVGYLGFVLSTSGLYWFDGVNWVELPINPVQGPPSALNREVVVFDGTTGKWITGSGTFIDGKVFYGSTSIYTDNVITDTIQSDGPYVDVNSDLNINEHLSVKKTLEFYEENNNASGDDQQITNPSKVITKFINSGLNSIQGIADGEGRFLVFTNKTGSPLTIKHLSGTSLNQIDTGIEGDLDMENNSSIMLYRDTTSNVWRVIGGTGSGSGGSGVSLDFKSLNNYMCPTYNRGDVFNHWVFSHTDEYLLAQFKVPHNYKAGKTIAARQGKFFISGLSTDQIKVKFEVSLYKISVLVPSNVQTYELDLTPSGVGSVMMSGNIIIAQDGKIAGSTDVAPGDIISIIFKISGGVYTGITNYIENSFELDFNYRV